MSKTALPAWKEGDYAGHDLTGDPVFDRFALLELPFMLVGFLWSSILLPLLRFVLVLPFAVVKGRRSRAVRIEAVTAFPVREVLLWTTTDGQVDGVLDEIAAGLAEGKVARPVGAVYSGSQPG